MKIAFIIKQLTLAEPVGIMALSSVLKKAGHRIELFVIKNDDVVERIRNFKPDIVAYSIMTGIHKYYLDYNCSLRKKLKDLKFISVFGGPHATFFPEIINRDGVDAVCRGEGEEAFLDFINRLERNEHYNTLNWWVKKGDQVIKNKQRPLIENLNDLPLIDRELIYQKSTFLKNKKIKSFMGSRGCPFNCTYCFNSAYKELYAGLGQAIRRRSVDNLLTEIKTIKKKYPMEMVWFNEDLFALDNVWLKEYAEKYKKEIGLSFCCSVRLNLLDEEIVSLLKESGCVSVMTAVETANDYMRNNVLNRNMSKEDMERGLKLLKKYGIKIDVGNIIGLPGETLNDMLDTLIFNQKNGVDYALCSIAQPYPGTKLHEYCLKNNYLAKGVDAIPANFHQETVIKQNIPLRYLKNLHHLFAMGVNWPFFSKFIPILIKLPLSPVYKIIYKLNYGYQVKTKIFPFKVNATSIFSWVKNFFNKNE